MRRNLGRDVFWVVAAAFVLLRLLGVEPWVQSVDAYAYWSTRSGAPYTAASVGVLGAYLYSPAFAQALAPITWLPWQVFVALWTTLNIVVYYRLVGPRLALPLLLFLPIPFEIVSGNVHILIAGAIVFGFRYPGSWVFPILTKVTPAVGLLWFVARREWRSLAVAVLSTVAVVALSFAIAPDDWAMWPRVLGFSASGPSQTPGWYLGVPLMVRLPIAAVLMALSGVLSRRWLVPVAVTLALPVVWLNGFATLVAVIPLAGWSAVRGLAPAPSGPVTSAPS